MAKVVIGGTFECLHDGHRKLLKAAFELAGNGSVDIGLTSDEMANMRERQVPDYPFREKQLQSYVDTISSEGQDVSIIQLNEPYGRTLEEDYDYIVVSPETQPVALRINELRKEKGKKEITVVKVDFVLADDERPISSTRIISGEIDIHGHLIP